MKPSDDTWCQTWSGGRWEILAPKPEMVFWPDIAMQLARQCRFNGAVKSFWSVASHSCLVEDILAGPLGRKDLGVYGLLHDAHEAYVGDVIRPVQRALGNAMPAFRSLWKDLCARQDEAIFAAAGLKWPLNTVDADALNLADMLALSTERANFLHLRDDFDELPPPLDFELLPETEERARASFLVSLEARGIYRKVGAA